MFGVFVAAKQWSKSSTILLSKCHINVKANTLTRSTKNFFETSPRGKQVFVVSSITKKQKPILFSELVKQNSTSQDAKNDNGEFKNFPRQPGHNLTLSIIVGLNVIVWLLWIAGEEDAEMEQVSIFFSFSL